MFGNRRLDELFGGNVFREGPSGEQVSGITRKVLEAACDVSIPEKLKTHCGRKWPNLGETGVILSTPKHSSNRWRAAQTPLGCRSGLRSAPPRSIWGPSGVDLGVVQNSVSSRGLLS